jgi:WD40 repeat protein
VASRQNVATLEGHEAFVSSVAFSPDGKTLASGSGDNTVKLWDISGIAASATPRTTQSPTLTATVSPTATRAASPSPSSTRVTTPTPSSTATPPTLARFSVTPRALNFGTVTIPDYTVQQSAPNAGRTASVTVTKSGTAPLTIRIVAIIGSQRGVFTIARDSCSGVNFSGANRLSGYAENKELIFAVATSGRTFPNPSLNEFSSGIRNFQSSPPQCDIAVRFSPKAPGRYSAYLLINTTAGQQTVPLTGVGVDKQQPAPTILGFTASPTTVVTGERVTLCYGVQNAIEARIDPGNIYGGTSSNNCYQVVATSATGSITYVLTARGRDGRAVSQPVRVRVRPLLPVEIIYFRAMPSTIAPGGRAQLCYGVTNARAARIEPDVGEIKPSEKDCVYIQPKQTTTYTLTATGLDGKAVTQRFTLQVRTPRN